jgi:regulator of sirC expression with transglutaminase-like and TPR domain
MAKQIKEMLPADASSLQKMEILIQYLYKAGPWNGGKPFRYDLDDPFGHNIQNKLLPTYLKTKRGNCISMPLLFILLGKKLDLDVTASTAPRHLVVKYRLEDRVFRNFEATSAGPILDSSMRRQFPMTDQALANGMYMRPLSKKQTVAVMAGTLMEFYDKQGQHERRIALANLALRYYPQYDGAMLHLITSYLALMQRDFRDKYQTSADIPMEERSRYVELGKNLEFWRVKVGALGWRRVDEMTEAKYMQTIQRTKAAQ